jgi:error-prone DNA polymerase
LNDYVELHAHSCFSLLDGASSPEALVARAAALGQPALALTDHDDLGGAVRFAQAARERGVGGIVGVELTVGAHHLVLLAESAAGYANLATLVTRARMDRPRGEPSVPLELVARHAAGLIALTGCPRGEVPACLAAGDEAGARRAAFRLREVFGDRLYVECWNHGLAEERRVVAQLMALAKALGRPWLVTNDVHYAEPAGRRVHDLLVALRHGLPLDRLGTRLRPNGEWYLKSSAQMRRRWRHAPEGLGATREAAERCAFRLEQLRPSLPDFPLPPGVGADEYLARLTWQGADERWGAVLSDAQRKQLAHELGLIARLGLAGYFLIVWDIVRFARRNGILVQGRGSAANSAVCYCLGITAVDPIRMQLLFERFLSEGRAEPPDIDLDVAHRERERVLQYVYERYGREHAAMVCEQITWRGRSAVRDVARALGFTVDQAGALAALSDRFSAKATAQALRGSGTADAYTQGNDSCGGGDRRDADKQALAHVLGQQMVGGTEAATKARAVKEEAKRAFDPHADATHEERRNPTTSLVGSTDGESILRKAGLDPEDRRVALIADLVEGLHQLPRHRSIHVGGFVLTREPLSQVVPIEPASMPDRTVIQWEKDDLDPVGLVKIDILGLGMLTLLQDCFLYIRQTRGVALDLAAIPPDDQAVYDVLCRGDTVGLFQVESRAQMNTLPRMRPRCFYDLVVEVALIRPGPIQGDMVHPYLRRRAGLEPVTYLHPALEPVLARTLGVPLFQEQGMQVAITAAGFTPAEADELRRAMGHKRSHERMEEIGRRLTEGMAQNGIEPEVGRRIYQQINAFADYGFPESHAASFALLVYASAWLRHYYAPEYTAAILNAQPMGFYSPGTLVEDARRHGVEVRAVDVTVSQWDTTLEPAVGVPAVRLGIRTIRGLGGAAREKLEDAMAGGPFTSVADVVRRTGLDRGSLRALAEAGALDGLVAHEPPERQRRAALWEVLRAERGGHGPLFDATRDEAAALPPVVPPMSAYEITEADYRMTALSLHGHPMLHLRPRLRKQGVLTAAQLQRATAGRPGGPVVVAGLVICRQRPGTAKGFVFLTLEDETGMVNVVVRPDRFERQALLIARSPLLLVRGRLQVEGTVINVRAEEFEVLLAPVGAEHARRHDFH